MRTTKHCTTERGSVIRQQISALVLEQFGGGSETKKFFSRRDIPERQRLRLLPPHPPWDGWGQVRLFVCMHVWGREAHTARPARRDVDILLLQAHKMGQRSLTPAGRWRHKWVEIGVESLLSPHRLPPSPSRPPPPVNPISVIPFPSESPSVACGLRTSLQSDGLCSTVGSRWF